MKTEPQKQDGSSVEPQGTHHAKIEGVEPKPIPVKDVLGKLSAPETEFKPFLLSFSHGEAAIIPSKE